MADTKTARPSLRTFGPRSAAVSTLNAFGIFAHATRDPRQTSIECLHTFRNDYQFVVGVSLEIG
ncbi:MAG: hypothetical protein AMJ63_17015 [Myxococcales bacterium SG8_38_1]|nr:MAG: hypothetical protein AMJ63_17015 [Myxococcales bacterium SG8_38_1]